MLCLKSDPSAFLCQFFYYLKMEGLFSMSHLTQQWRSDCDNFLWPISSPQCLHIIWYRFSSLGTLTEVIPTNVPSTRYYQQHWPDVKPKKASRVKSNWAGTVQWKRINNVLQWGLFKKVWSKESLWCCWIPLTDIPDSTNGRLLSTY